MLLQAKQLRSSGGMGGSDNRVTNNFHVMPEGRVLLNDNLAHMSLNQVGHRPMVLKHDLGIHTEEPATAKELKTYMNKLRDSVETK
jgi:hypothetical protein